MDPYTLHGYFIINAIVFLVLIIVFAYVISWLHALLGFAYVLFVTNFGNPDSLRLDSLLYMAHASSIGARLTPAVLLLSTILSLATVKTLPSRGDILIGAAARGDETKVKRLLAADVNAGFKDERGVTPLHLAAGNGHEGVVKLLLANNSVDPNSKDKHGMTALSSAVINEREGVVKLLLANDRVDPSSKDEHGMTALSWAVRQEHNGIAKLLLAEAVARKRRHEGVAKALARPR